MSELKPNAFSAPASLTKTLRALGFKTGVGRAEWSVAVISLTASPRRWPPTHRCVYVSCRAFIRRAQSRVPSFPPVHPQPLPTSSRPHSNSFLPRVVTQWDKLTSVAIPVAASVAMMGLIVKGIDDLRYGKNRKEGF